MKKLLIAGLLLACAAMAHSQTATVREAAMVVGFEWGNYFDHYTGDGKKYSDYAGSPGIVFQDYSFSGDLPLGFFSKISVLFPAVISQKVDGIKTDLRRSDFDFMLQLHFAAGPALRFNPGEKLELYLGLGLDMVFFMGRKGITENVFPYGAIRVDAAAMSLNFGVGADVNVLFNLTDAVFLNAGTALAWDFYSYQGESWSFKYAGKTVDISDSYSAKKYYGFSLRPYIALGIRFYGFYQGGWGKPPAS